MEILVNTTFKSIKEELALFEYITTTRKKESCYNIDLRKALAIHGIYM